MKKLMLIIISLCAISAQAMTFEEAAAYNRSLYQGANRYQRPLGKLSPSQQRFFNNRRIAVSRDTTTIPGAVITTWYRNGKLDTLAPAVVTNILHAVSGEEQKNPLQVLNQQLRETAERWHAAATNATAKIEYITAELDERRAEYVEKRDSAVLPSTKAIYQAFIDAIDRIKERITLITSNQE